MRMIIRVKLLRIYLVVVFLTNVLISTDLCEKEPSRSSGILASTATGWCRIKLSFRTTEFNLRKAFFPSSFVWDAECLVPSDAAAALVLIFATAAAAAAVCLNLSIDFLIAGSVVPALEEGGVSSAIGGSRGLSEDRILVEDCILLHYGCLRGKYSEQNRLISTSEKAKCSVFQYKAI